MISKGWHWKELTLFVFQEGGRGKEADERGTQKGRDRLTMKIDTHTRMQNKHTRNTEYIQMIVNLHVVFSDITLL